MSMIEIWTDGSCKSNPGIGGWGWVRDDGLRAYGGNRRTADNRMKLVAIITAMQALPSGAKAVIYSDGQYCVSGLMEWRKKWKKTDWMRVMGCPCQTAICGSPQKSRLSSEVSKSASSTNDRDTIDTLNLHVSPEEGVQTVPTETSSEKRSMTIQENTSLTDKEFFRMHGTLTSERIERLIELKDRDGWKQFSQRIGSMVQEAMGQYPAEDFLSEILTCLHNLAKRLRGDNKEAIQALAEKVDDIAQTTFNAADYGRSELQKVLDAIEKAKKS